MARKANANPVTNAPRARVPARAGHSCLGLRCGERSSGWGCKVQANLSAVEGVANICSRGSRRTLLWGLSKAWMSMRNRPETIPTNLAKINKLPASKIWASSDGTGRETTRGFAGLGEKNAFGSEGRICRLVLLLL
jgi:hypothetical protein